MNYPNKKSSYQKVKNLANLGMHLEDDIDSSNLYYLNNNIAIIYKKPTPIQVVSVNYPSRNKAKITEAYYKTASTTDYNGIYKGKYIDFDAKETNSKTSIPLANIHAHQINHLQKIFQHGGIGFLIINFKAYNEYYLLLIQDILPLWNNQHAPNGKKSISYIYIKEKGFLIPFSFMPRLDYLKIIDKLI